MDLELLMATISILQRKLTMANTESAKWEAHCLILERRLAAAVTEHEPEAKDAVG